MAYESSVIVGSGIGPLKKLLCPNSTTKERHLRGTQVVVINPEDGSAGGSGLVTAVTVNETAVQLPSSPLVYRRAISICNNSALNTLYIGFGPELQTGTGWPIPAGTTISMDVNGQVVVYGISDGAGTDVRILELS
ncbi:MAG: hypothetical protein ACXABY_01720 [Candidatus Thorarchaeota archaeon]|jgi:hypothetical protein